MTWKLELLFEFEILDKGLISLIVGSLEIGEKLGTLCDVNCQRTLCTIVVSVGQRWAVRSAISLVKRAIWTLVLPVSFSSFPYFLVSSTISSFANAIIVFLLGILARPCPWEKPRNDYLSDRLQWIILLQCFLNNKSNDIFDLISDPSPDKILFCKRWVSNEKYSCIGSYNNER